MTTPKIETITARKYSAFSNRPLTILINEISFLKNQNSLTDSSGKLMPKPKNINSNKASNFRNTYEPETSKIWSDIS